MNRPEIVFKGRLIRSKDGSPVVGQKVILNYLCHTSGMGFNFCSSYGIASDKTDNLGYFELGTSSRGPYDSLDAYEVECWPDEGLCLGSRSIKYLAMDANHNKNIQLPDLPLYGTYTLNFRFVNLVPLSNYDSLSARWEGMPQNVALNIVPFSDTISSADIFSETPISGILHFEYKKNGIKKTYKANINTGGNCYLDHTIRF